jgi:hypothetical protein
MTTGDPARTRPRLKRDWALSPTAFQEFLTWLGGRVDSGGERYVEMRRRLEDYFARKRCATPSDLADDVLNRVARRLEEEGAIPDPPARTVTSSPASCFSSPHESTSAILPRPGSTASIGASAVLQSPIEI